VGQSTEELTSQIEDTRQRMAADLDILQDRVSPSAIMERRKQAVRGRISSMKERVMGTAQSATGSVSSAASSATSSASGATSSVTSTAQDRYEGAPLAAGLVAFGAGVVLASLVPASGAEAEAAHRVVETAKDQGGPLLDEAHAAAQEVARNLKDSATQSAQHVKDSAQESAQAVQGEARSSVETVRDQAPGT
jgi:cell division septum initiation protein DivIVA